MLKQIYSWQDALGVYRNIIYWGGILLDVFRSIQICKKLKNCKRSGKKKDKNKEKMNYFKII